MSLLDDVSLMITPNGVAEDVLFGVLPQPIIGAEKVTDGDFPTGTSAWTTAPGWAIANGSATCSSGNDNLSQNVSAVAGKTYKITLDVTLTSGRLDIDIGDCTKQSTESSGTKTFYMVAVNTDALRFYGGAFRGSISNVSVREYTSADMDFTRATTATRVNSSSNIEDVPRNLLEYSEDLTNSFWNAVNSDAIVASTIPSPDGANFGFKAIPNTENNHHYVDYDYANVSLASPGSEVTYSVYVKPFGYTNFQLAPSTGFNSNSFVLYQNFELTGDGVKGTGNVNGATIEKIGDWYRCSITETTTDYNPRVLNIALPSSGLGRNPTFEGNGNDGVLLWGGQIEKGTSPTTYIPTTDRLNVPRLDYTGGGCPHILVEPQRTNICLRSELLNGTSWTKQNVTVTANSTTSPDGTVNAEKVAKDGVSADDKIEQGISISNSTSYSVSAFLKNNDNPTGGKTTLSYRVNSGTLFRKTYEWTGSALAATTTYDNGTRTNEFLEDYGNGWYRVGFSFTSDGTAGDVEIDVDRSGGTSTTSIYVWGCQLEEGAYATSYIPTLGSTVTRNAEVFTRTGIGDLINSSEGVLFIEMAAIADDGTHRQISLSDGSADNRVTIGLSNASGNLSAQIKSGGAFSMNKAKTATQTNFNKIAVKWKVNDMAVWLNGSEVDTDVSGAAPIGLDTLTFNRGDNSNYFYGEVKQIQVYKTALSDTQLGALTT
tara:strand:+ start:1233 stop:3371 length:2139 start_codon:yes stop_codon:yes gene_type:complete